MLIVDEAPKFVPKKEKMLSSKVEILSALDLSRSYGVSIVFGSQSVEKLDKTILEQCRFIFISYNLDVDVATDVFKKLGLLPFVPLNQYKAAVRGIMNELKKYKDKSRDWLLIDRNTKKRIVLRTFAPLSYHLKEI